MLTKQGGLLEQSLIEGGVNPLAANDVMGAVANCSQPLTHRGPVSADYTPPDFNYVTQFLRKYRFPNLDSVSGEMPPIRPKKEEKEPEEDRLPQEPERENQSVRPPFQPTYDLSRRDAFGGVTAGRFIVVEGGRRVSLRAAGSSGDVAVFRGDSLQGGRLDISSTNRRVLTVEKADLTHKIKPQGKYVSVVTGVSVTEKFLRITTRECFLFDPSEEKNRDYDHTRITYLSNATLEGGSLQFETRDAYVVCGEDREGVPIDIPVVDCEA